MSRIQDDYKKVTNYFSGFRDICEHKTGWQVLKGVGKIFSYCTLVVPLIFMGMYHSAQKKERTYKKINQDLKTQAVFNKKVLIPHLMQCLEESKADFQAGFKKLSLDGQQEFFQRVIKNERLFDQVLDYLPRDIEEIGLNGSVLEWKDFGRVECDEKASLKNTQKFLRILGEFTELKKLQIDLRGVGKVSDNLLSNTLSLKRKIAGGTRPKIIEILESIADKKIDSIDVKYISKKRPSCAIFGATSCNVNLLEEILDFKYMALPTLGEDFFLREPSNLLPGWKERTRQWNDETLGHHR